MKRGLSNYLPEFVYGAIDGSVTTFAVVAGAFGAELSVAVILILGFANLFADGFSMAVSNYLSTKSRNELNPIRHKIHRIKGKDKIPIKTAIATFISFLIIGFIPLFSFVAAPLSPFIAANKFPLSFILTGIAFIMVGAVKGKIVKKSPIISSLETFIIGSIAALVAFLVGYLLRGLA